MENNTIVIHNKQVAEMVTFGDLKPNSPFYMENPFNNIHTPVHYTCEDLDLNTPVWVIFSKQQLDRGLNPWVESGPIPSKNMRNFRAIGAALFSGLDHNLCK